MPTLRTLIRCSLLTLCGLLLVACVARHPAGIAPSTAPVSPTYTVLGPTEESDCAAWLLILPLGGKASTHTIIERLVKDKGADALIGVTVEERVTSFLLFGNDCTVVKGTAVKNVK
jgi:hypothetical protein